MGISSFDFTRTHSYSDHPTVARAKDRINGLPSVHGYLRLGDNISAGTVTAYITRMKQLAANEERQIANLCAQGYKAEVIDKHRENVRTIGAYVDSLETIRNYMNNYQSCCRGTP